MAISELWVNIPVKDVQKSKAFFKSLGLNFNEPMSQGDDMACLLIGKTNTVVMLIKTEMFKGFVQNEISNSLESSEVLFSIGAESKDEVNQLAEKIKEAGGIVFSDPAVVMETMYGCGFTDLDGHRWNILFMNEQPTN